MTPKDKETKHTSLILLTLGLTSIAIAVGAVILFWMIADDIFHWIVGLINMALEVV